MSAHDIKLFGDQVAASRIEVKFAGLKAASLLRLAIQDLFLGRIALVSSFGADSAVLLHMISGVDKRTPVIFVDTGQHFPETIAYRDELVARLGLQNVILPTGTAKIGQNEYPIAINASPEAIDRVASVALPRPRRPALFARSAMPGHAGDDRPPR